MPLPTYTIGGTACDVLISNDGPQGLKERVASFERPGIVGAGAQRLGLAPGEFSYAAVKFDTLNNCVTWAATMEALQGTVVTIADGFETWTNRCLILRAAVVSRQRVITHVAGVEYRFEMRVDGKLQPEA